MNETTGATKVNRTEIAKALGVNLAHISRIFSGKSTPSLGLAQRMAEHMGISLDELYRLIFNFKKEKEPTPADS